MREVKFRAWDGEKMNAAFDLSQNPKYWWEGNKDYPLIQYTGLKDGSGIEIYEGDVVSFNDFWGYFSGGNTDDNDVIGEVKYVEDSFLVIPNSDNETEYSLHLSLINDDEFKVIGNIYKNPELMEVTN